MNPPEIDPIRWSHNMRDFVKVCLTKDPRERPCVDDLMKHPFIAKMAYDEAKTAYLDILRKYQESTTNMESIFSVSMSNRS